MDLFDLVDDVAFDATDRHEPEPQQAVTATDPADSDHWEGFEAPEQPTDAELEAQFCGQERAGIPSCSKSGLAVRARWRAYLEAQPADLREWLERIEEESYRSARRRVVATRAIDEEETL